MKKIDSESSSDPMRLLAQSSVIVFIGIALSKLLTYLYRVIIARELGPEIYGLFSLALVVSSFFVMAASLGLPDGALRYLSFYRGKNQPKKSSYLFRSAFCALLISSIVAAVILYFSAGIISTSLFHNIGLTPFLKVFGIFLPFSIIGGFLLSSLLAFGHVGWNALINNFLQNFVKVLVLVGLLFFGLQQSAVIASYVAGIVVIGFVAFFAVRHLTPDLLHKSGLKIAAKRAVLNEVFAYSWPIVFLAALYTVFNWTDSAVIGYFMTASDVGIYNAAFTLISLCGIAPELFRQFFFPYIVREYSRKNNLLIRQMSQQVGKWIYVVNLPLFLFMAAFPGAVINILFGPEYLTATDILRILAVGGLLASFNTLLTNLLSMQGKSRIILINTIGISLLDLILNIILVPRYGLYGAAGSTTFSLGLLGLIMLFQVRNSTGIVPFRRKMWSVTLAAAIPAIGLLMIKNLFAPSLPVLALAGITFVTIYFVFIFAFGSLDPYDKDILSYALDKLKHLFRKK